jgi:hypothetical protein
MYTTGLLFLYLSFFLWYNLSKKATWKDKTDLMTFFESEKVISKIISFIFLSIALLIFIYEAGLMSGLCIVVAGLMTVGCLTVAIFPFRYLNYKLFTIIYLVFVTLEILI